MCVWIDLGALESPLDLLSVFTPHTVLIVNALLKAWKSGSVSPLIFVLPFQSCFGF